MFYRSTCTYKFLLDQQILPLPCPKTIRRYLSLVKSKCGFDKDFFLLLKKKFSLMSNSEKHGMLVFDEISLRESIRVNTNTLTYQGFEDFGSDVEYE